MSRPILVTGSHRSGTTWVGRMIEAAGGIYYVHEPFNPVLPRPGLCDAPFRGFTYIHAGNAAAFEGPLQRVLDGRFDLVRGLRAARSRADVGWTLRYAHRAFLARRHGARPLLKDPIALFSSEWLADRFDMDVVVMIRHPGAFVGSIKRIGWRHDLQAFLDQPELVDDLLDTRRELLERAAPSSLGIVEEAAVAWVLIHEAILRFRERRPAWAFIAHEDLSTSPLPGFADLFRRLGLELTPAARQTIEEHSHESNPAQAADGVTHQLRRNSRASLAAWGEQLDADEIAVVRGITGELASRFYPEDSWNLAR